MNETKSGFSGFLKNKNTITIFGTMIAVGILLFGYFYEINKATTKVPVLVAKVDIQPKTRITCEMVETVEIAQEMFNKLNRQIAGETNQGIMTSSSSFCNSAQAIITFPNGGYSNYNTMIPKGSVLIKGVNAVDKNVIPSSVLSNIPTGYIPYSFAVKPETTYGNAIMDGMYVDIYMKAVGDDGKVMIGKFIKDVKVLAVLDASGRNVFENTSESRTTANFIFGVDEYYHLLFRKASYLSQYGVELIPVPVTKSIDTEKYYGSITVTSKQLEEFVTSKTATVTEDELPDSVVDDETTDETKDNKTTTDKDKE